MFLEVQDRPIATPTKPAPLDIKRMVPWLKTQSGAYDPNRVKDCPLNRWLISLGFDANAAYHLAFWMGETNAFDEVLLDLPHTYEGALQRALTATDGQRS